MILRAPPSAVAAALLVALAGCNRDFSLPAEPQTDLPPEFLGPLAGVYELALAYDPAWFPESPDPGPFQIGMRVPALLFLQELEIPGREASVVTGVLNLQDLSVPEGSCGEAVPVFSLPVIEAVSDGEHLEGVFRQEGQETRFTGRVLAGGRHVELWVEPCPGAPQVRYVAERRCQYDPSLSGVYAPGCAETPGEDHLGLGLLPGPGNLMTGVLWRPDDTPRLLVGGYDWTSEFGYGLIFDEGSTTGELFALGTRMEGGQIRLDVATADLSECVGPDCARCAEDRVAAVCRAVEACEGPVGQTPVERFTGCRQPGETGIACAPPAPRGLSLALGATKEAAGYFLQSIEVSQEPAALNNPVSGPARDGLYGVLLPFDAPRDPIPLLPGYMLECAPEDWDPAVGLVAAVPSARKGERFVLVGFGQFGLHRPGEGGVCPPPEFLDSAEYLAALPRCVTLGP